MSVFTPKRAGRPFPDAGQEARLRHLEDEAARRSRRTTQAESTPTSTEGMGLSALFPSGGGGGGVSTLGGDVTGPAGANTVERARNQDLTAGATAGDIWYFNGTAWVLLTPTANDNLKVPVYVHASTAPAYRTPPYDYRSESADYTATLHDYIIDVDASGAARTITLPTAASAANHGYYIRKTDNSVNTVTIDPNGGETINGAANHVISVQFESALVVSNATSWGIY